MTDYQRQINDQKEINHNLLQLAIAEAKHLYESLLALDTEKK